MQVLGTFDKEEDARAASGEALLSNFMALLVAGQAGGQGTAGIASLPAPAAGGAEGGPAQQPQLDLAALLSQVRWSSRLVIMPTMRKRRKRTRSMV